MFSLTVHDLLEKNVRGRARDVAVVEGDQEVTWGELGARVEQLAAYLAGAGVRRGDRVAIQLLKSVEEIVAIFATARLGAIFVNLNHQRTVAQSYHMIEDSGSRVAIVEPRAARPATTRWSRGPTSRRARRR
jgi:acyl-CoA synthetase (AMP-forming)/AMP-acid ligase II